MELKLSKRNEKKKKLAERATGFCGAALILVSVSACVGRLDGAIPQPPLDPSLPLFETIDASSFSSAKALYSESAIGAQTPGTLRAFALDDFVAAALIQGIEGDHGIVRITLTEFALRCDAMVLIGYTHCKGDMAVWIKIKKENQVLNQTFRGAILEHMGWPSGYGNFEGGDKRYGNTETEVRQVVGTAAIHLVRAVTEEILEGLSEE